MITKLDEALSICVVLGVLTQKQASTISSLCEATIVDRKASGVKSPYHSILDEMIDTPGTLFVTESDILELISPNPNEETIQ